MIQNAYYQFRILLSYINHSDAYRKLKKSKVLQKNRFRILVRKFSKKYRTVKHYDNKLTTIKLWRSFNKKLSEDFLPTPSDNFLRNPLILRTMFASSGGTWLKKQLNYLETNLSSKTLKKVLKEDLVGNPVLANSKYISSHNSINHLYHIARFLSATGSNLSNIRRVVEWGGGYGNMAKIFKRLNRNKITYIIIDTPLFSCLQWLYLSTIFGEREVLLIKQLPIKVVQSKINILPIGLAKSLNIKTDLFVSTWALSESSKFSQDLVIRKKWFGAKRLLLGYQKSSLSIPYANRIHDRMIMMGAKIEPIDFLPGNFYAFL